MSTLDWGSITLGEENPQALLTIRNGLTTKQDQGKGDYKISRIETIGGGWIDETRVRFASGLKEKDVEKYRIQKGDILFSHINSDPHLGKTGFAEKDYEDLLHGMNLLLIRANPEVFEAEFLNRVIQYYRNIGVFISICSRSVNQSSINQARLKAVEVPLPPLPEQKKIAHILSTVQRAIEAQDRIIQTTAELFKSMLHQLMTAQIRVSNGDRIGKNSGDYRGMSIQEIPFPSGWKLCSIAEAFDFTRKLRGFDLSKNGDEVPFFPMNKIPAGRVQISDFTLKSLSKLGSGTYVESGDLMVAKITPSFENGKQAIVDIRADFAYATTEVIPLRGREGKSNTLFLFFCLLHPEIRSDLAGKMEGSTGRQRLSKTVLGDRVILLPPLSEQKKIARILSTVRQKIDNAQSKKSKLQDLFLALLHELMTAEIRVDHLNIPAA